MNNPVQDQMRPFLTLASPGYIEFKTNVMYDTIYRTWTYKVWEISISTDEDDRPWRMREMWVNSNEDGDHMSLGDLYEPKYFESLDLAIVAVQVEVESYV